MPSQPPNERISQLSIANIRELISSHEPDDALFEALLSDSRAGVQALARSVEHRHRRAEKLKKRQEDLLALERRLMSEGKTLIAGVDEAGRGPLAGPVVAAAVILPEDVDLPGIDDSKKLSAKRRAELYGPITERAVAWGIGMADNEEIDDLAILDAAMKAMRDAVADMGVVPDIVLVDGNRPPGCSCKERAVIDGDNRCRCIAAASIVAKVTRDRLMVEMDELFPVYGFARHKGYGSADHIAAIAEYGPCPLHRFSFRIVPAQAPAGTSAEVLKHRLMNAVSHEALERTAAIIARIRDTLHEQDIRILRDVYRRCSGRFS